MKEQQQEEEKPWTHSTMKHYRVFSTKNGKGSTNNNNNKDETHEEEKVQETSTITNSSTTTTVTMDDNKAHDKVATADGEEDPFGLHFQDSLEEESGNIGPRDSLPPNYIRDSQTGKFTGKIRAEVSKEDQQMLNMSQVAKDRLLKLRVEEHISKDDTLDSIAATSSDDDDDGSYTMANVARRIREEEITLNTLGRKVDDILESISSEDGGPTVTSTSSTPLTPEELESLHKFMQKTSPKNQKDEKLTNLLMKESKDLLPISIGRKSSTKSAADHVPEGDDVNPDLDLEWLSAPAQRVMASTDVDAEDLDDPFANLMPSDLNPAKKVNRRRAKPIPKELLHHNNLSLLRRYVTPGGQIMNRIQSRLGAKDQRQIARLVKRARHLGLIPVLGQWKFEDRGSVKDPSIYEDKEWEQMLMERGLVERKSPVWEEKKKELASKGGSSGSGGKVMSGW
jgi:Ribosomal protein S18